MQIAQKYIAMYVHSYKFSKNRVDIHDNVCYDDINEKKTRPGQPRRGL